MNEDLPTGKILKDYTPSSPPPPATFSRKEAGVAARIAAAPKSDGVFDSRGTKSSDASSKPAPGGLVPFEGLVNADDELRVAYGVVVPRNNDAAATGSPIDVTDLPVEGSELPVASGDKCYVKLTISPSGEVSAAVFEKASSWPTDTPPILAGGDNTVGVSGTRHIRILEIVDGPSSGTLIASQIHTGHIDHFQPVSIENTGGGGSGNGRVLKEWSAASGRWELRYISKGIGQATVEEVGDEITIRGTKFDGKIDVVRGASPSPEETLEWADGFWKSGQEVNGNEDPPVEIEPYTLAIPTVIAWDDPDAQIQVTNVAGGGLFVYEVRGNAVNATFSISQNGGSPETLFEVKDGLVISETKNIDIDIEGLPPGNQGDMLYHNGTNWVLLAAPTAPGTNEEYVLNHNGTTPSWNLYEKLTVKICISGVPTDYQILGKEII